MLCEFLDESVCRAPIDLDTRAALFVFSPPHTLSLPRVGLSFRTANRRLSFGDIRFFSTATMLPLFAVAAAICTDSDRRQLFLLCSGTSTHTYTAELGMCAYLCCDMVTVVCSVYLTHDLFSNCIYFCASLISNAVFVPFCRAAVSHSFNENDKMNERSKKFPEKMHIELNCTMHTEYRVHSTILCRRRWLLLLWFFLFILQFFVEPLVVTAEWLQLGPV